MNTTIGCDAASDVALHSTRKVMTPNCADAHSGGSARRTYVMRKLADSHRLLAASPDYLTLHGRPVTPDDLRGHACLRSLGWGGPWRLSGPAGELAEIQPPCRLRSDNGEAVHDWALAGLGIRLKSAVDISTDLRLGRLEQVLPDWRSPDAPIYALIPSARHVANKTRLFLDTLKEALVVAGAT